ncbi:MAG: hypothetical protein IM572_07350 [Chitinophagaceae bacterium]|nr:hypothetical protein [Chitinophagaceae bacterium]MCA6481270.1 hypothetical protein [Chitinophagaceae bacterium]MCA6489590.1 hypothetical protein [Chitinophagaceae bacterium]MCA6492476.1 hypothetical protein [Chitinophagaceae bacterium]MCA6513204.1 hypothetical protein [Chitinophagaceae bacterium]
MRFAGTIFVLNLLLLPPMMGFKKQDAAHALHIVVQPICGNRPFSFDSSFVNAMGETFQVSKCLFYLSNFSVTYTDGKKEKIPASYFLIDLSDSRSCKIQLPVQNKKIQSIHFLLGIDSATNVRGIQKGVLDPARGMFWTWNTGYVMAKMEGTSTASNMPGKKFSYHIGGYAGDQNVVKSIELFLTGVKERKKEQPIVLLADVLHWFNGPSNLSIAQQPNCHSPGELAQRIAENYQSMFSIQTTPNP